MFGVRSGSQRLSGDPAAAPSGLHWRYTAIIQARIRHGTKHDKRYRRAVGQNRGLQYESFTSIAS